MLIEPVTGEVPFEIVPGGLLAEGRADGELATGGLASGELTGGAAELTVKVWLGSTEAVSVTGHTVVEMGMVEVTTGIELAGQSVTVGAQLVMVYALVA